MRWTRTLIPTFREDPSDADAPSTKLLLRAGMIRRMGSGITSYLPLGARVLNKAGQIVREEITRAGGVEIYLPIVRPRELSGQGEEFLKLRDSQGRVTLLGGDEEEVIAYIARNEISSYRQLPLTFFQIRPKLQAARREEIAADAYSLHTDGDDLDREYRSTRDVFERVFERAGLKAVLAESDSGHEFLVPSAYGESEMVRCPKCRYTAEIEKAECVETHGRLSSEPRDPRPLHEVETPGMSSVDEVASFVKAPPHQIVKTMVLRTENGYVAALVRGDHSLNMSKLLRVLRVPWVELASPAEVERATGGAFGYSGPVGLPLDVVADLAIEHLQNFVTGANKKDFHYLNTNPYRDFKPAHFGDIRRAQVGDLCSRCMGPLEFVRAFQVGRLAHLGTRVCERAKATYKNEKGEPNPIWMGSYRIAVTRLVAAAVESHHDARGIIWPKELAPFPALLCTVNPRNAKILEASESIYQKLMAAGIDTLWDDRDVTPGVKFSDADLVGLPVRITVGNKTLKDGTVDLKSRNKTDQAGVSISDCVKSVKNALKEYRV